jgi:PAS domain S-box-containing protein
MTRQGREATPARGRHIDLMETLQKLRVPSAVVARDGTITWLNDAARESFGDLVGKPVSTMVAPKDVPVVERNLAQQLGGEAVTESEVDVVTADRRRRRAEISSVRIPGGDACHAIFGIAVLGKPRPGRPSARLTKRQDEVLQLLGAGASTSDVAASLHLSVETVRNHIQQILRAFGVHSRVEAIAFAHRHGLLRER